MSRRCVGILVLKTINVPSETWIEWSAYLMWFFPEMEAYAIFSPHSVGWIYVTFINYTFIFYLQKHLLFMSNQNSAKAVLTYTKTKFSNKKATIFLVPILPVLSGNLKKIKCQLEVWYLFSHYSNIKQRHNWRFAFY